MAEFIENEAMDVDCIGGNSDDDGEDGKIDKTVSDEEFIDDSEQQNVEYPYFANVSRSYNDTLLTSENFENLEDVDARHYFDSDNDEDDLHYFSNFETKAKAFRESLICPHGLENPNSFFLCNSVRNSS